MPTLYSRLKHRGTSLKLPTALPAMVRVAAPESYVPSASAPARAHRDGPRVLVIGAGFAGLAAAYELTHLGYDVAVLEARNRIGGRVLSLPDVVSEKVVEGGGELIGSNHPMWNLYKSSFGLHFLDVDEGGKNPLVIGGRPIHGRSAVRLLREMQQVYDQWNAAAARITDPHRPWTSPDAPALDRMSLSDWLATVRCSELCELAIKSMMENDNGVPTDNQSWLANLAMIAGGGGQSYWDDSERYRCAGGNDSLATHLARPLGDRVKLRQPVSSVRLRGSGFEIQVADGQEYEADDVVLAIPPSVWGKIVFHPALPRALHLQMGRNVKFLMVTDREFWKADKVSANFSSDGPIGLVWESTEGQCGAGTGVVAFSGGSHADKCRTWKASARARSYVSTLRKTYTTLDETLVDSQFKDWPADPWVLASYSFPKPGEVMRAGQILADGIGRLRFAGEHTCYAFVGYMEGALQSGVRVAKTIASRDGLLESQS